MGIIDSLKAGLNALTGNGAAKEIEHWVAGKGQEFSEKLGIKTAAEIHEVSENVGHLLQQLRTNEAVKVAGAIAKNLPVVGGVISNAETLGNVASNLLNQPQQTSQEQTPKH